MSTVREEVVFFRVGWTNYYNGPQLGDEGPIGGGEYNETDIGGEAWSFQPRADGNLYAYFHPSSNNEGKEIQINLERIDAATHGDTIDHLC